MRERYACPKARSNPFRGVAIENNNQAALTHVKKFETNNYATCNEFITVSVGSSCDNDTTEEKRSEPCKEIAWPNRHTGPPHFESK